MDETEDNFFTPRPIPYQLPRSTATEAHQPEQPPLLSTPTIFNNFSIDPSYQFNILGQEEGSQKKRRREEENYVTSYQQSATTEINQAITNLERVLDRHSPRRYFEGIVGTRIRALGYRMIGTMDTAAEEHANTNRVLSEILNKLTTTAQNQPTNTEEPATKPPRLTSTPAKTEPRTQTQEPKQDQPNGKPLSWAKVAGAAPKPKPTPNAYKEPKANDSPMRRHHPSRVIIKWHQSHKKLPHQRAQPTNIVEDLNKHLTKTNNITPPISGAQWTEAGNLVLIAKTPDAAKALVGNFHSWKSALPEGADIAHLDQRFYQVVMQGAWIRRHDGEVASTHDISQELHYTNNIDALAHALPPRILASKEALAKASRAPILLSFRDEKIARTLQKGAFFKGEFCAVREYVESTRTGRCQQCHELTHPTRKCTKPARCVQCGSAEHASTEHPTCDECTDTTTCTHNLKCINCNGNHASNYAQCPVWLKKRGTLKEPNTKSNPPNGGRTSKPRNKKPVAPGKATGSTRPATSQKPRESNNENADPAKGIDPPPQQQTLSPFFKRTDTTPPSTSQSPDAIMDLANKI